MSDDQYTDGHTIKLDADDPTDSHYIQLDADEIPRQPVQSQIKPKKTPVVHWGVHFLHEDVVSDYGPGEDAKDAAEKAVVSWAHTDYPAEVVSQTILPWTNKVDARVTLIQAILEASSDPQATLRLRHWLVDNGYEDDIEWRGSEKKSHLPQQVPFVRNVRKVDDIARALPLLDEWLIAYGYVGK